jgi:hypothetical protein
MIQHSPAYTDTDGIIILLLQVFHLEIYITHFLKQKQAKDTPFLN